MLSIICNVCQCKVLITIERGRLCWKSHRSPLVINHIHACSDSRDSNAKQNSNIYMYKTQWLCLQYDLFLCVEYCNVKLLVWVTLVFIYYYSQLGLLKDINIHYFKYIKLHLVNLAWNQVMHHFVEIIHLFSAPCWIMSLIWLLCYPLIK